METYKIIHDEKQFEKFIDWLPDLTEDEQFYGSLFARKKYDPVMIQSSDKTQLKRFLTKKERIYQSVASLEAKMGNYYLKGKVQASQKSLVLYINPNPRDLRTAGWNVIEKMAHMLRTNNKGWNPVAEVMSLCQKTKSYNYVVDFDFDIGTDSILIQKTIDQVVDIVGKKALTVVRTRGGIHCLVKPKLAKEVTFAWYMKIAAMEGCDILNMSDKAKEIQVDDLGNQFYEGPDIMLPVPGCTQGGFIPYFIDL